MQAHAMQTTPARHSEASHVKLDWTSDWMIGDKEPPMREKAEHTPRAVVRKAVGKSSGVSMCDVCIRMYQYMDG